MTKIAIVSDIHGNIHALNTVLEYLDKECKVSKILNIGDFIQIGPNSTQVFDVVMNDKRFVNIMGNSEAMFFDDEIIKFYEKEKEHQQFVINQLGKERMARLKEVPLMNTVEIEGKKLFMVHARMNSVISTPLLYDEKTLKEFTSDYDVDADYVLIGHTHFPLYALYWNWKPILNPGSLGCGKDGIAKFIIMEIDDGVVNVLYKQLKYDKQKVIEDYKTYSVPCSEKYIAMFY